LYLNLKITRESKIKINKIKNKKKNKAIFNIMLNDSSNPQDLSKQKENIQKILLDQFKKNKLSNEDSFDQSAFFLKNDHEYYKNITNIKYFSDLKQLTPSEGDDIMKIILIRSLLRSKSSKIKVSNFIEEIADSLIKLNEDKKRVDTLIKRYDAYKTKNIIEEYLNSCDYSAKLNDIMKSAVKIYVSKIEGLPRGEYKCSLMAAIISNRGSLIEEFNEEIFDYKLNHIVKIDENDQKIAFMEEKGSEYHFPEIELYSYELTGKERISPSVSNYDTGTNLLFFFLKIENLNKNYEDIAITEQKPLLELFLHNLKPLMDNYSLTKTFYTDCPLKTPTKNTVIRLKIVVDFDPITLSTVFNKIVALLKNIISFKVLVDHKWKTILKYFPDIEDDILNTLALKEKTSFGGENTCVSF
jgi:hypothetical protein